MTNRSKLAAIGGYQPFLFCVGMYIVSLFFSIFICSAIFHAINPETAATATKNLPQQTASVISSKAVSIAN